ncbi:MAG: hypothetical protein ACK50P_00905, partial [Planctomycetaceae bacterium]
MHLLQTLRQTRGWLFPLMGALLLAGFGWWMRQSLEQELRQSVIQQLTTVRNANVEALQLWLKSQKQSVTLAAQSKRVEEPSANLVNLSPTPTLESLQGSKPHTDLVASLESWVTQGEFEGFVLLNRNRLIIGTSYPELLGKQAPQEYGRILEPVFAGQTVVSRPFPSAILLPDEKGNLRAGLPTMYAAAPI